MLLAAINFLAVLDFAISFEYIFTIFFQKIITRKKS